MSNHRVLIVGTVPYNNNSSSRAFDSYFHNWEKSKIRQIFSNTKTPVKGHCSSLYQITDQRLLRRLIDRNLEVGLIFEYQDLPLEWKDNNLEVDNIFVDYLYKLGSKDSPFKYLARKWLWKRKYWDTLKLRSWLDEFDPECVFLAFSDDFFISEIALYVSERFNIPILSCIGDDYFFNDKVSLSPLYYIYRYKYKKLIKKVFTRPGSAIYIGDKIRDKYNLEFGLKGKTVYLSSEMNRLEFKPINVECIKFCYAGNIRHGRNLSLVDIGNALQEINELYKIDVYSNEKSEEFIKPLRKCSGIIFHGSVPYSEVNIVMNESDILIIVEGFNQTDINITRYSLSTKAADSMAIGKQIITYGSIECGVIEYMKSTECSIVCTKRDELVNNIKSLIYDIELQKELYSKSLIAFNRNHNKEQSVKIVTEIIDDLVKKENE